jgi:hypothetical protein
LREYLDLPYCSRGLILHTFTPKYAKTIPRSWGNQIIFLAPLPESVLVLSILFLFIQTLALISFFAFTFKYIKTHKIRLAFNIYASYGGDW